MKIEIEVSPGSEEYKLQSIMKMLDLHPHVRDAEVTDSGDQVTTLSDIDSRQKLLDDIEEHWGGVEPVTGKERTEDVWG